MPTKSAREGWVNELLGRDINLSEKYILSETTRF
jgi:hypothetical protein